MAGSEEGLAVPISWNSLCGPANADTTCTCLNQEFRTRLERAGLIRQFVT